MRKNQVNTSLTEEEIKRNKKISKVRYKMEQYFGITSKYHGDGRAQFTTIIKEIWDHLSGAMAFNIKRAVLAKRREALMAAV